LTQILGMEKKPVICVKKYFPEKYLTFHKGEYLIYTAAEDWSIALF
jgi:hypothetical protein